MSPTLLIRSDWDMVGNMNYHFSVMIAKEVGVDGAIMLENMH